MLADIKDRVTKLETIPERVARMEAGNAERCKARGELIETIQECHEDHETRIRKIEQQSPEALDSRLRSLEEHKALSKGQQIALTAVGSLAAAAAGTLAPILLRNGQ
jgi:UTP:GlnB (protein PII) uridylyltransferase